MPIGNIPIVVIIIKQLASAGIKEIIMAVGHRADLIKTILGNGQQFGVKIKYSPEKKPLGTAAPLKRIKGLKNNFLVLNGDVLTDLSFSNFGKTHIKTKNLATIAVHNHNVKIDFGVIDENNGKIINYFEKPKYRYTVSMGVYAFNKKILKYIPNKKFDFPDLVEKLIRIGEYPDIFKFDGHWLDIGCPEDWQKADKFFQKNSDIFISSS
jgi:NDP-sugar pyrophosphorylase family protein